MEAVGLALDLGLAKFGTLLIDGSTVRTNASKRKAMTCRRMNWEYLCLEVEIRDWLRKVSEINTEEDAHYGEDRWMDEFLK